MIKDNQKSLNRFHVVLDACVTAFSYLLAWFIVIGSGWANQLGKRTLEVGFYFGALLVIIPAYLLLYSLFGLYTPKRVLGRRNEFGKIFKANSIGFLIFGLVLYLGRKEPHLYNFSQRLVVYFYVLNARCAPFPEYSESRRSHWYKVRLGSSAAARRKTRG